MSEQQHGNGPGRISVNVRNLPEVLFAIRKEFADVLRGQAGAETNPVVARRFREVADEFEAGMAAQDARWVKQQAKRTPRPRRSRGGVGDD